MDWFGLTLLAALFLGFYDIAKKQAVAGNAVPPVLLANVATAACIWAGPVLLSLLAGDKLTSWLGSWSWAGSLHMELRRLQAVDHVLLAAKSAMVGSSWIFAFFALKHLPISVAAPVRATSPMWAVLMAIMLLGERPDWVQACGILLIIISFLTLAVAGAGDGIRFHRDRWILFMLVATLISAGCGIYDKFLLQTRGYSPAVVQAWFSIYLVPVMLCPAAFWWFGERQENPFVWRWTIPLIAVLLLIADFAYFTALADPQALISVVSPLRRTSVLVPFLFGVTALRESNWFVKLVSIAILLFGVFLLSRG